VRTIASTRPMGHFAGQADPGAISLSPLTDTARTMPASLDRVIPWRPSRTPYARERGRSTYNFAISPARPYLVVDRSLDECIRQFQSVARRHLYEIHTAQQIVARRMPARSTGSRHSSFGFNRWMLRYCVRGQACEGLVAKAARKKTERTAKEGAEAASESGFAA